MKKSQNKPSKKLIFVSSRLRGDMENNMKLAECLCRIVALKNQIPIAPHIYFTRFLDDRNANERELGLANGLELLKLCDELWAFTMDGISEGMQLEIDQAKKLGKKIRYLGGIDEEEEQQQEEPDCSCKKKKK
jgi:hypothetical protein